SWSRGRRGRRRDCGRRNPRGSCAGGAKLHRQISGAIVRQEMKKTLNAQHSTLNVQWGRASCALLGAVLMIAAQSLHGQESSSVESATKPLAEGVPQVAVERLRQLLGESLSPNEKQTARQKLGEALCLAGCQQEALKALDDSSL